MSTRASASRPAGRPRRRSDARSSAARVVSAVLGERRSLAAVLPAALERVPERDHGLLRELCYGTLRWHPQLQFLLDRLLERPLAPRQSEVTALLLVSLYQLLHLRVPDYAAVSEAVAAARGLGRPWAAGLVNGVLRAFLRRREVLLAALQDDPVAASAHPAWLLRRLQADWPDAWPAIVTAGNARPPLGLRVNLTRVTREDYGERLAAAGLEAAPSPVAASALTLSGGVEAEALPGFREGLVSVQDPAAQLAAPLLNLKPGLRVLDACAAPGGKSGHILECEPRLAVLLALDVDVERLQSVRENLTRLGLRAQVAAGDARQPGGWWDGLVFDRILVDAPCSGSGVIRRHPDIKRLRAEADVEPLARRQRALLEGLWPLLAPGAIMLYATCSVLRQENASVVTDFLAAHPDAREWPIAAPWGRPEPHGRQILPGEAGMDGFFYARLRKSG